MRAERTFGSAGGGCRGAALVTIASGWPSWPALAVARSGLRPSLACGLRATGHDRNPAGTPAYAITRAHGDLDSRPRTHLRAAGHDRSPHGTPACDIARAHGRVSPAGADSLGSEPARDGLDVADGVDVGGLDVAGDGEGVERDEVGACLGEGAAHGERHDVVGFAVEDEHRRREVAGVARLVELAPVEAAPL